MHPSQRQQRMWQYEGKEWLKKLAQDFPALATIIRECVARERRDERLLDDLEDETLAWQERLAVTEEPPHARVSH